MSPMVDYFKAVAEGTSLYENPPPLLFEGRFNTESGEIGDFKVADFDGLRIKVYRSGFLIISGSLHKFWNSGSHNANDFHLEDIHIAIDRLSGVLGLSVSNMILQNLEVGFNLSVPNSRAAVDGFFLHNAIMPETRFKGYYKEFKHSDYSIKLYSKSYQYELKEEVLRCEIKMVKSRYFNRFGVFTLEDLLETESLRIVKNALLKQLEKMITCYPLSVSNVKSEYWSNPNFWVGLDKRKRYYEKKLFEEWKETQSDRWPPLNALINQKFDDLTTSLIY